MSTQVLTLRGPAQRLFLAGAVLATLTPAASAAELVSRVGGEGGQPFAAQLAAASSDGRYVVLKLGTPNTRIEPTVPEAVVNSPSGYVLKDRESGGVIPIAFLTADNAPIGVDVAQVSRDGLRVLAYGQDDRKPYVFDRRTGKALALPTTPGIPTRAALSDDGQQVVVSTTGTDTMNNPAKDNAIYRGPVGGTGALVVKLYGVTLVDTSDDLQTVLYTRELPKVTNPLNQAQSLRGKAIGLKQGDGAPHVVAQNVYRQTRRDTETCTPDYMGIRTVQIDVNPVALSGDGGRAIWSASKTDSDYQGLSNFGYHLRSADGSTRDLTSGAPYLSPRFEALARTHSDALIPTVAFKDSPTVYRRIFVDGDRTVISSDQGSGTGPGVKPTRYVTADAYTPDPTPVPSTLTFTGDEPVDTNDLKADITFAGCEGAPAAEVASIDRYARLGLTTPMRSTASIGVLSFVSNPEGYRTADRLTVEVKLFGLTTWKRTLTTSVSTYLTKPLAWLPQTVRVTVQPTTAPGGAKPAPLVKQYSIYPTR